MKMLMSFLRLLVSAVIVLEYGVLAPNSWRAMGAKVQCKEREREALLHFKAALGDDDYGFYPWSSWGSQEHNRDCCEWEGVHCSNRTGHVLRLHLPGVYWDQPTLKGNISASLMELQYLMYFNLSDNIFKDNSYIPEFLGSLSNLRYLDLKNCIFEGNIPSQLGHLSRLRYLDLGGNLLKGSIPHQFGNLSQLRHLDLLGNYLEGAIPYQLGNFSNLHKLFLGNGGLLKIDQEIGGGGEWLSSLTSLTHLSLETISDLTYSHKWLQMIAKLPRLKELILARNELSDQYILSLSSLKFNSSSSLSIDLSSNFMSSKIFHWIWNVSSNLVELNLRDNPLEGPIPYEFGSIDSLESLDLSYTQLKGGLKSLGNICTLRSLSLSFNDLSDDLQTIFPNLSACARYSLKYLDLSRNQITGTLLELSTFTSLETIDISWNLLNGTIPEDFRFPSSLVSFYLHSNSLDGILTDSHFADMSNLKTLDLSDNSLALRFSHNWVPPFQLQVLLLRSCKLGPDFPTWLQTQENFTEIDISNARISSTIPEWFWGLLTPKLTMLNVSCNNFSGTVPNVAIRFTGRPIISLAYNNFEGPVPQFLHDTYALFLSNNYFSELELFLCANRATKMELLDLSNNQFFGQLPDCWSHFKSLYFLDLSNNRLSGEFPISTGSLHGLRTLIFRNNMFTGELPVTLRSFSHLTWLDVAENRLSGPIPSWMGTELHELEILILRNNNFSGELSIYLCYLSSIRILDLSLNNLSGKILKCFRNFSVMAMDDISSPLIEFNFNYGKDTIEVSELKAWLMWKGTKRLFEHYLYVKGIDVSSNQLTGNIPAELGILVGLVSLNLSRNQLGGEIPSEIGRLTSLEFLDLSRNHFIGPIPPTFTQIDRLSMLDLSFNNLSGKIPISTQLQSFDNSSYEGNLGLCGKPLEKKCREEEKPQDLVKFQEDKHSILSKEFYWSMTFGFITGFWGVFGSILLNRSCRRAYFRFLNNLIDTIYVMVTLNTTKCKRWLRGCLEKPR